jgi:hypothetical protein
MENAYQLEIMDEDGFDPNLKRYRGYLEEKDTGEAQ